MKTKTLFRAVSALLFSLGLLILGQLIAQDRQTPPPEYKELVAASQLTDAAARLKEFERIKTAYPNSQFMAAIERSIVNAKIELTETLDGVLALQQDFMALGKGPVRLQNPFMASDQILRHPRLKTFDKAKVLAVILKYKDEALKAAVEPGTYQGVPQDQQETFKSYVVTGFDIPVAQAYMNAGDAGQAMAALDAYKKGGGATSGIYFYTLAGVCEMTNKTKEAYDAYLTAAVENYEDATARAKDLYAKLNGKAEGFEAALEAKLKLLPYHPEPFQATAAWKGQAVLAELFTGSECPPCVGADLGFDGLIETYPTKYLAVLEYHLPIPRPDPMMNSATKKRQDYYGVNSTPTVVIGGDKKIVGGGSRGMAEGKFKLYKTEIDSRLGADPGVRLKIKAARAGDTIKVEYDFDKTVPGAEYQVVLVQGEEIYKGSNGLAFHKMVVRDLVTIDTAAAKRTSFDLAASEQATDRYLTEFENTNTRFKGFKFAERHFKIDRVKIGIVFFAQDKETKKILNAVVTEVK